MATRNDSVLILDRAKNAKELEFLMMYREADAAGKRRITKMLAAAARGELPSLDHIEKMTRAEKIAFADSLPEVQL